MPSVIPNILADGQLAAASGTLLTGPPGSMGTVNVIIYNSNTSSETVTLTVARPNGGTARTICVTALAAGETLLVNGIPLPDGAILAGLATDASKVNYFITVSSETRLSMQVLTASGASKSGTTSSVGTIQLDLGSAHIIAANAITAKATAGGIPCSDSAPTYQRINAATDKGLVLSWAATVVAEVQLPQIVIPPDLDPSSPVTFKCQAKMGGATDTPTIAVAAFEGIGDTNRGGNTAALSNVLQTLTVSLTLTGNPNFLNMTLIPAAHGTDALNAYAAWLEYTRR
jgi:hypothetical protein